MIVQLQTRVTKEMAAAFAVLARRQRVSTGELLRTLVLKVIEANSSPVFGEQALNEDFDTTLQTRVPQQVKAEWRGLAKRLALGSSEMLRGTIRAFVAGNPVDRSDIEAAMGAEAKPEATHKVSLQLLEHEVAAVDAQAARLGWRRNSWIANVVRSAALSEPRPTAGELAALNRSNAELLAVGRNLNQIARAMHRDDRYKDSVTLERIDELRRVIVRHVETQQPLLIAIQNRWAPGKREGEA